MQIDILLLFEHSGLAAEPFTKLGYRTCIVDKMNIAPNPRATYTLDWDILEKETELREIAKNCILVIGFPPCDDLAVSGAKHFWSKWYKDNQFQSKAIHLFRSVERIAGTTMHLAENPKSIVATHWRKANFMFSPGEYGGYLPENDSHPDYPQYINPRDAYPKETFLWTSTDFLMPEKKKVFVEPGFSKQFTKLGGKSLKTKKIRAASPRGFFIALAEYIAKTKGIPQ